MRDTLFSIMIILIAANGVALLYMLLFHCNIGWDGYGLKWDSKKSGRIAFGLIVLWFVILYGCVTLKPMTV